MKLSLLVVGLLFCSVADATKDDSLNQCESGEAPGSSNLQNQAIQHKDYELESRGDMNLAKKMGIVFDMDYTLCYPTVSFDVVFEEFFKVPFAEVSSRWLEAIYQKSTALGSEIILHAFPAMSTDQAKQKAVLFAQAWAKVHKNYIGCEDLLKSLKNDKHIKLGLMTNGPSDFQRAVISYLGLEQHFDCIVVSGDHDMGVRKPDTKAFEKMAEKMGLHPASLFMIGDNFENDIMGSKRSGWAGSLLVKPTDNIEDCQANLPTLKNLLLKNGDAKKMDTPTKVCWRALARE